MAFAIGLKSHDKSLSSYLLCCVNTGTVVLKEKHGGMCHWITQYKYTAW